MLSSLFDTQAVIRSSGIEDIGRNIRALGGRHASSRLGNQRIEQEGVDIADTRSSFVAAANLTQLRSDSIKGSLKPRKFSGKTNSFVSFFLAVPSSESTDSNMCDRSIGNAGRSTSSVGSESDFGIFNRKENLFPTVSESTVERAEQNPANLAGTRKPKKSTLFMNFHVSKEGGTSAEL